MKQIARVVFLQLFGIFVGCRSERAAYFRVPAPPFLLTASRPLLGSSPARVTPPAPTAAAAVSPRNSPAARPRRRWFTAEAAAGMPPPTPAADPAAAIPGRQRRQLRLGRSAPQQSGTQRKLPPLARGLLALAGILVGLVVLLKLIFDTSFLVAFGVVAGLVVVGLAVLWLVLRNSKGFGWH